MKRLIVNADDLGYGRGVNAGVLRAHREGIVTASTLMTNAPASEEAAALARGDPTLDVGIHLVLTFGRPLSDPGRVPSLVGPEGAFLRPREIVGSGRLQTDEILLEFRAQFARGRELIGRDPSHIDAHHWVEQDPAVLDAFVALAAETGAAARSLTRSVRERLRAAGVRTTDAYRRDFQHEGHIGVESLVAVIASLEDGTTELGCHPGEDDPDLMGRSSYARERPVELASLTDQAVRNEIARRGIELATFASL